MIWNDHSKLEGMHAFLGASQYHWINWDLASFEQKFYGKYATEIGTAIHALAEDCIKSRTKLAKHDKHLIDIVLHREHIPSAAYDSNHILTNLMPFVNDAIGFSMTPEVILYYSNYCFGTADAISFNEKTKILRIHDLKTGSVPAHWEQLLLYSAMFCLEYHKDPRDFKTELRIYQSTEVSILNPEPEEIQKFMDLIISRCQLIDEFRKGEI